MACFSSSIEENLRDSSNCMSNSDLDESDTSTSEDDDGCDSTLPSANETSIPLSKLKRKGGAKNINYSKMKSGNREEPSALKTATISLKICKLCGFYKRGHICTAAEENGTVYARHLLICLFVC